MLTHLRTWIARLMIVLIIGAFYLLFRNIKFDELAADFARLQVLWLLPALAVYMLGYVIRGFRWVILLNPIKKCSFKSLFPTLLIGFMANNVTPLRLGEFIRAHLNGKKEGISRSASLGTIILERLFDGMAMLVILGISLSLRHPASTSFSQNIEG